MKGGGAEGGGELGGARDETCDGHVGGFGVSGDRDADWGGDNGRIGAGDQHRGICRCGIRNGDGDRSGCGHVEGWGGGQKSRK